MLIALEESPLKQRIRDLGERLDSYRKRQQEQHPGLTLTSAGYQVLRSLIGGYLRLTALARMASLIAPRRSGQTKVGAVAGS